jgi:hypothetical protein
MIGRITNGGFNMRSRPLILVAAGVGLGESLGLAVGDGEVSGDAVGEGDVSGLGDVDAACRVKVAQGPGGTLAQRR